MQKSSSLSSEKTYSSMVISINGMEIEEDPFYEENHISDSDSGSNNQFFINHSSPKQENNLKSAHNNYEHNFQSDNKKKEDSPKANGLGTKSLSHNIVINQNNNNNEGSSQKSNPRAVFEMKDNNSVLSLYRNIIWKKGKNDIVDICDICGNSDSTDIDAIYICDLCNCTAHQSCYGGSLLEKNPISDENDEWLCDRCRELLKENLPFYAVKCIFCPELKGSIKLARDEKGNKLWVHVSCVNWNPDIYFQDEIYSKLCVEKPSTYNQQRKKTVILLQKLKKERFSLLCYLCRIPYGACIQCDNKNCVQAFHVTCGQRHGLIPNYDQTNKYTDIQSKSDDHYLYIYCRKHQNTYPQALQVELIQIQSNFLREKNNISFLYNTSNQNNKKFREILKSEQGISDSKKHQNLKDCKKAKKSVKNEKKSSFIELEDDHIIEETKQNQNIPQKTIKFTNNNSLEKNISKKTSDKKIISKNSSLNVKSKKKQYSTPIARKSNIISCDENERFNEIPMKKSALDLKRKKPSGDSSSLSSNDMEDLFKPDKKINNASSLSSSPSNSVNKKYIQNGQKDPEKINKKLIKISPPTNVLNQENNENIRKEPEPQKLDDEKKSNNNNEEEELQRIAINIEKNTGQENNLVNEERELIGPLDNHENKEQKNIMKEQNIPVIESIKNDKKSPNKAQFKEMILKNSKASKRNNKENFVLTNSEIFWCNVILDIEKNELESKDLIFQYSEEFMNLKCKQ